ncbi:MAG: EFR1 family ferrodoxin [Promethearchaeota archaeon]
MPNNPNDDGGKATPIKIALFMFSGTGNTWWASKELLEIFKELNPEIETTLIPIEKKSAWQGKLEDIFDQNDIIGLSFPVYESSAPKIVRQWIDECPVKDGKKFFIFTTMMIFSGDTALHARHLLKDKKYSIKQCVNIQMFSNISVPYFNTWKGLKEGQPEKRFQQARKKLTRLARAVLTGKKWYQRRDPISKIFAILQRSSMEWVNKKVPQSLSVDENKCTKCLFCVNNCPMENIEMVDGKIKFNMNCTTCIRCYNLCPQDAILFGQKTKDRTKFVRYKPLDDGFYAFLKDLKKSEN